MLNLPKRVRKFLSKTSWSSPRSQLLTSFLKVTLVVRSRLSKMHSCNSMSELKLICVLFTVALEQLPRAISPWHPLQLLLLSALTLSQNHKLQSLLIKKVLKFASTLLFIKQLKKSNFPLRVFSNQSLRKQLLEMLRFERYSNPASSESSQVQLFSTESFDAMPKLAYSEVEKLLSIT